MYKGKKFITIFHLLVIKGSEDIVESYIKYLIDSGLYFVSEKILLIIRYTDSDALSNVVKMFDEFDEFEKFDILETSHNDSDYSPEILKYFTPSSDSEGITFSSRLGEVESIINMTCNQNFKDILKDYDLGFFIHSKSMSHLSQINIDTNRTLLTTIDEVRDSIKSFIYNFREYMEATLDENIFGYDEYWCKNRAFTFKTDWVLGLDIEDYFKMYSSYKNYEIGEDDPEEVADIIKYNGEVRIGDKIQMLNRHVFFNFPLILNHMKKLGKVDENFIHTK